MLLFVELIDVVMLSVILTVANALKLNDLVLPYIQDII